MMTRTPTIDWNPLELDDLVQWMAFQPTKNMPNRDTAGLFVGLVELGWEGGLLAISALSTNGSGRYSCCFLEWKGKTMNILGESVEEFFDGRYPLVGDSAPAKSEYKKHSAVDVKAGQYIRVIGSKDTPEARELIDAMRQRVEQIALTQSTPFIPQAEQARPNRRI